MREWKAEKQLIGKVPFRLARALVNYTSGLEKKVNVGKKNNKDHVSNVRKWESQKMSEKF